MTQSEGPIHASFPRVGQKTAIDLPHNPNLTDHLLLHICAFMQLKEMEQTASYVSGLLKMLSHRDRLMALCHLAQGEMAAGALAEAVGMKPPAMSQQLAILRREGLIASRRDGQTIYYRIDNEDAVAIMGFLYDRFCGDEAGKSAASPMLVEESVP